MFKHTQTFPRQKLTNCLGVFDNFVGLALQGLRCYYVLTRLIIVLSRTLVTTEDIYNDFFSSYSAQRSFICGTKQNLHVS